MTTPEISIKSAAPITVNEVKNFYLDYLVPVGQGLQLVAKCFDVLRGRMLFIGNYSTRSQFQRIPYHNYAAVIREEGFLPLHLINCYLQSPLFVEVAQKGDRTKLAALAETLMLMRKTLCEQIIKWAHNPNYGSFDLQKCRSNVLENPSALLDIPQSFDVPQARIRLTEMEDLILGHRSLHEQIFAILGVTPATYQAWVKKHVDPASPLTKNGHIAYWRTLVNNLPWDVFSRGLGLSQAPVVLWLGSRTGRERVDALIDQAFSPNRFDVPPSPPAGEKLPLGVTVASTADGYLVVEGSMTSRRVAVMMRLGLDVKTLAKFAAHMGDWITCPPVRVLARSVCSLTDLQSGHLVAVIHETGRVVAAEIAKEEAYISELETIAKKLRQAALTAKLNEHFSPEDIAELTDMLAQRS